MDKDYIRACINDLFGITHESQETRSVGVLEAALFVEDIFGIVLTDKEICGENLGDHKTLKKFVLKRYNW